MNKTKTDFKLSIFAGDNIFSYLLILPTLTKYQIDKIYISKYNQSIKKIKGIYRKTSIQYFIYRSFVQILSLFFKSLSIEKYAKKNNIDIEFVASKKDIQNNPDPKPDICIAVNFDLIIPSDYINSLKYGIMNIHASDLPKDKGISPVVWAFCRGDSHIYISFYLMDGGIDTGSMILKEKISVDRKWSLFRTYCEVLIYSSLIVPELIRKSSFKNLNTEPNVDSDEIGSYHSWPDKELHKKMKINKRKYFKFSDFLFLLQTKRKLSNL